MITQFNFWVNYPPALNFHSYNYIAEEEGLSEMVKDKITLFKHYTDKCMYIVNKYTVHKCKVYSASFGTQLVTLEDPHARELMALKKGKTLKAQERSMC